MLGSIAISSVINRSKNQEIMEMLGFGPSHNKIEVFSDHNEAE